MLPTVSHLSKKLPFPQQINVHSTGISVLNKSKITYTTSVPFSWLSRTIVPFKHFGLIYHLY